MGRVNLGGKQGVRVRGAKSLTAYLRARLCYVRGSVTCAALSGARLCCRGGGVKVEEIAGAIVLLVGVSSGGGATSTE